MMYDLVDLSYNFLSTFVSSLLLPVGSILLVALFINIIRKHI